MAALAKLGHQRKPCEEGNWNDWGDVGQDADGCRQNLEKGKL